MILDCQCGEKKFVVPDNAIPAAGRLVQCSYCGSKWIQYPVIQKERVVHLNQPTVKKSEIKKKRVIKQKKKRTISSFSQEYLNKKYGINLKNPESKIKEKGEKNIVNKNTGLGFYGFFVIFVIILVAIFGILNLTREIIIYNFPFLESYINYLYETIDNFKSLIEDFFSSY